MYVKDGALIMGQHDLDHAIGMEEFGPAHPDHRKPGSQWFLDAIDRSGELYLMELVNDTETSIEDALAAAGITRIVFEIGSVGIQLSPDVEMDVAPVVTSLKK
jgi:hypothetical protein